MHYLNPRRSRFLLHTLLPALVLAGCTVRTPPAPPPDPNEGGAAAPAPAAQGPDIGDVEHGLSIELTIPEGHAPDGVRVEELRSFTKALNMASASVAGDWPETLPVFVSISPRFNMGHRLVVLRGHLLRDDAPIAAFHLLVTPEGPRMLHVDGAPVPDLSFAVDALAGLDRAIDTTLLHAAVDAMLLPPDTEESAVDPATVTAVPTATTTVLSNPLRVNRNAGDAAL